MSWRTRLTGQEEGAEVNYSITVWLSQELFKQTPVSRGLVLITPARVIAHDPSPLPLTVGLSGILGNIHMVGGGRTHRKKKEIRTKQSGKDRGGEEEQTADTLWLNSSGLPASPELIQGYNYPPKCPSVARLTSKAQVTLSPTEPNPRPSSATASPSSSSSRCLMALCDNDGALVCRKDGLLEIRSMSVLCGQSTMGQFSRSTGHESCLLTVSHHLVKMCHICRSYNTTFT